MGSMIIKIVICIVVPILLLGFVMEKRSRRVAIGVVSGCLMCLFAYYINPFLQGFFNFSDYYLTTSAAPFVEETLKFIPVFVFSLFIPKERKDILPVAFSVGVGFAIVENSFMLSQYAVSSTIAWMLVRGVGAGLMHAMSTLIMGFGIRLSMQDKRIFVTGTLASLFLAMMYHGAYNAIIQVPEIKFLGILIPIISYAVLIFLQNKEQLKNFLSDEI